MLPGSSELLGYIMHVIAQSLLIPCIVMLMIFVFISVLETGALIGEMTARHGDRHYNLTRFLSALRDAADLDQKIKDGDLPAQLKRSTEKFLELTLSTTVGQRIIAQKILSGEEHRLAKIREKTELIAKMGPLLGLMGTLIPLGPGLVGLGKGDFNMLAQYLIVSFDATIIGILAGALSFTISKIRARWYERYMNDLDATLETIIEVREHAAQEKTPLVGGGI